MTSSSDPTRKSARPSREPPTIDLTATEVSEGAREEGKGTDADAPPREADRTDAVTEGMLEGAPAEDPASPAPASPPPAGPAGPFREPERAAEPARRGPGFGSLAAASLLGGLVGAGAMLAFGSAQPNVPPADPRIADLERRIGALPQTPADTGALERRLAALEGAQTGLNQRLQEAQALAQRGAARADEAFNRAQAAPAQPAPAPQAPQNNPAVAELGNRVGALDAQLRQQGEAAARERQALQQRVEAAAASLAGVERRLGEQDRRIAEQERRASEGEQRLAALGREAAEGGSPAQRAGTRLILANRLDAALRDGAPYADVLEGLRRLGTDAGRLGALEPFAGGGAPSAAALAQSFKPLGQQIGEEARAAPAQSGPAGTWTDRLVGLVGQVVSIRPVAGEGAPEAAPAGSPAGGSPTAVEQALARGDLAAAAAAWDALPEPARQASADWGRQLKQRAAAEAASRALAADAVAALNTPTR